MGNPVALTDRGPWYRGAVLLGGGLPQPRAEAFGLRSYVERFGAISKTEPEYSTTTSTPRTHSTPPVGFLELFMHWYV